MSATVVASVALTALACARSSPLAPGVGSVEGAGVAGEGSGGGGGEATAGDGGVAPSPSLNPSAAWNIVLPGAGCGRPLPAGQPMTVPGRPNGYMQYAVMGTGATLAGPQPQKAGPRTFWVRVPADYDPNHAYRVVYIGQGCGAFNSANFNTDQLYSESQGGREEAIYVAIDIPTDMVNMDCYDNRDGPASQEWEAFALFHTVVDSNYCVDNNHVFVAGYSTGGWLANQWGCYFAGDGQHPWNGVPGGTGGGVASPPREFAPNYHLRGQAVVSGGEAPNNPPCNGPVAALWVHDQADSANPIAGDQAALARVLRMNGCEGSPTAPWHPEVGGLDGCRQYTACPADYPVVFCTTSGLGKTDEHSIAIPAFTLLFEQVSPSLTKPTVVNDAGATDGDGGDAAIEGPCVPECLLGTTGCGFGNSVEMCVLNSASCPVFAPDRACGPNTRCDSTVGPGVDPCMDIPPCPVVPAGCSGQGTFCLDATTVATCLLNTAVLNPGGCLFVSDSTPCPTNHNCSGALPTASCQ